MTGMEVLRAIGQTKNAVFMAAFGVGLSTGDPFAAIAIIVEWIVGLAVAALASLVDYLWTLNIGTGSGGGIRTAREAGLYLFRIIKDGGAWLDGVVDVGAVVQTSLWCFAYWVGAYVLLGVMTATVKFVVNSLVQNIDVNPIP